MAIKKSPSLLRTEAKLKKLRIMMRLFKGIAACFLNMLSKHQRGVTLTF